MTKKRMDVAKFERNTAFITAWAEQYQAEVISLNKGIQLRVKKDGRQVDIYPSTGKVVGGGIVKVIPNKPKGMMEAMNSLFKPVKVSKKKCECRRFYCYDDEVLCLHKIFKQRIPEMLTRTSKGYGNPVFELWSRWLPRYMNGSRWRISEVADVQLVIELCKQYNVPMQRL